MSQREFPINLDMNRGWSMITETKKINRLVFMWLDAYTVQYTGLSIRAEPVAHVTAEHAW